MLKRDPSQIGQSALGESKQQEDGSPSFTFREALRTRQFWLISGVYLLMAACIALRNGAYRTSRHRCRYCGSDRRQYYFVIGAVSIITKVAVGIAIDRLGNKTGRPHDYLFLC